LASPWLPPGSFSSPASGVALHHSHYMNPYLRYGQSDPSGDFAPFPLESMHPPQHQQDTRFMVYSQHERSDPVWPQQPREVRSMSYGQIEGIVANSEFSHGLQPGTSYHSGPLRHAPPTLEMQQAAMIAHAPGPSSAPIEQHHHFIVQPQSYAYQHQTPHSIGVAMSSPQAYAPHSMGTAISSPQAYAGPWYHEPSSFGPLQEEHHGASDPPAQYAVQPHHPG
ncbi:hypothetical protein LTR37_008274, partial [Vermiconidia calcicola]